MHVELAPEEHQLLTELRQHAIRELREEVHRTVDYDYKRALMAWRPTLAGLVETLAATSVT